MIRRKTVFVLGAGASAGVGYPTGLQLAEWILNAIAPGSSMINDCFAAGFTNEEIADFRKYFKRSHGTIDMFLAENPDFRHIGRFLIAKVLMALEDEDGLIEKGGQSWYRQFRDTLGSTLNHLP